MARTETLSVRVSLRTRRVLSDEVATHDAAGASALAREILEKWADEVLEIKTRGGIDRAVRYLRTHPEGWADDPADFFPEA